MQMLIYLKPFFLLNVAKNTADPWYLQQTGKKLVKVRIKFIVRDLSDLRGLIFYIVCVVVYFD